MTVEADFRRIMVLTGQKRVTHTDVNKGAYVPNADQRQVLARAGYEPVSHTAARLIDIHDSGRGGILPTSYYASERSGSGRQPEPRMGRGLLERLHENDTLLLGTDGTTVFALVLGDITPPAAGEAAEPGPEEEQEHPAILRTYREADLRQVVRRAREASGQVRRRTVTSRQYERDPAVRELARRRSGCRCEMPGCGWEGFLKADGTRFIEVHHIQALGDDGEDAVSNVAALCPNCHRLAHFARDRREMLVTLSRYVEQRNAEFFEQNNITI